MVQDEDGVDQIVWNHFDNHLNVKGLIRQHSPNRALELGALDGRNTRQLVEVVPSLVVISDGDCPGDLKGRCEWVRGISYRIMRDMELGRFQFVSIDTDHNGWTLDREMKQIEQIISPGGIVVIHDTVTHWSKNGFSGQYHDGTQYPDEALQSTLTMGEVLNNCLARGWEKVRESKDSQGAMAIRRVS